MGLPSSIPSKPSPTRAIPLIIIRLSAAIPASPPLRTPTAVKRGVIVVDPGIQSEELSNDCHLSKPHKDKTGYPGPFREGLGTYGNEQNRKELGSCEIPIGQSGH